MSHTPLALSAKKTREGYELRVRHRHDGKRSTPKQAQKLATQMLKEVLEALEENGSVEAGLCREDDRAREAVVSLFVESKHTMSNRPDAKKSEAG